MLDQFIGSIKNYFYTRNNVPIYDEEIPDTIQVPSMYFPQPNILPLPFTKGSYQNNYIMNIQVFEEDTPKAMSKAESIAQTIRSNKNQIPLLNADGTATEKLITFSSVACERMESGIVQVRLEWENEFNYN